MTHRIHANTSLTILNKARTNTLQLNDRNRHTTKESNCMICDKDEKKLPLYVALWSIQRREESQYSPTTTIYLESDKDILRHFLFDKEDIEEKKELLMEKKTI